MSMEGCSGEAIPNTVGSFDSDVVDESANLVHRRWADLILCSDTSYFCINYSDSLHL